MARRIAAVCFFLCVSGCERAKPAFATSQDAALYCALDKILNEDGHTGFRISVVSKAPMAFEDPAIAKLLKGRRCQESDINNVGGDFYFRLTNQRVVRVRIDEPVSKGDSVAAVRTNIVYGARAGEIYSILVNRENTGWVVTSREMTGQH